MTTAVSHFRRATKPAALLEPAAVLAATVAAGLALLALPAVADEPTPPHEKTHFEPAPGQQVHAEHSVAGHDHGDATHGEAHGHHVPTWSDINWVHGFLGEKEGVEPSLLWRPPGMPVPVGALFLNTAVLFWLLGRFFGRATKDGLKSRKTRIAGEIEAAAKMKKEAEGQLAYYEDKLAHASAEMDRIKKEMREQAEAERERILKDAQERQKAMELEARQAIEQELAHARQEAVSAAISAAVSSARQRIAEQVGTADHERLASQLMADIDQHLGKERQS